MIVAAASPSPNTVNARVPWRAGSRRVDTRIPSATSPIAGGAIAAMSSSSQTSGIGLRTTHHQSSASAPVSRTASSSVAAPTRRNDGRNATMSAIGITA